MEPLKYLQIKKEDVIFSITSATYTEKEANEVYQRIIQTMERLSSLRMSKSATENALNPMLSELYVDQVVQGYILQAIECDDTYVYAYNLLAKQADKNGKLKNYPLKVVDEEKLFELVSCKGNSVDIPKVDGKKVKNIAITGFKSDLTELQIQKIYEKFNGEYFEAGDISNFRCIFVDAPLPQNFQKVKWIDLNPQKKANQTSFREFLKSTMKLKECKRIQNYIDNCFTDSDGKRILYGKNKESQYSEVYLKKFNQVLKQ